MNSFHFISLHRLGINAHIFWSSFLAVVLHPARRHGTPFSSGWRIFYILQPPTLRTSRPPHSTFIRPASRRHGLLRPTLSLWKLFARATEKLSLDWSDEPRESQSSKLDEHFLSGSGLHPKRRKLAFFPDLHYEVFRSWKQPFSSHLTNAAAADFTNLVWFCGAGVRHSPDGRGHASCAPLAAFCPLLEERHLWLNLTEIRDKEKAFLIDAPISGSGLFGDTVMGVWG